MRRNTKLDNKYYVVGSVALLLLMAGASAWGLVEMAIAHAAAHRSFIELQGELYELCMGEDDANYRRACLDDLDRLSSRVYGQ